jgi:formylglycine-generating enzyme required for sulfatase activity
MKTNFLLYILLLFYCIDLQGQSIQNVKATQHDKTILITYDLVGLKSDQTATISLFCSEDGGNIWGTKLHFVTGDVGQNISAGYGKQIVWQVLDERERLTGSNISFEVRAMLSSLNDFGIEMVYVKGGTFQMGSNDGDSDEKPVHTVTVSDFYIGKYEVTQKQWREIMGNNPSNFKNCDNCPVEMVSWNDVQEFIKKLNQKTGKNYRLPTEAEWEYAARGGSQSRGYKYAGSNNIGEVAWYDDNSSSKTHAVGGKKPNELGIYDMSGNVYEWCSDWYGNYSAGSQRNPQGPTSGPLRLLRGGSWGLNARYCRVSNRLNVNPGYRINYSGFRLAVSP